MISFLQYSVHASSILFFNEPTFLLYEINNSISVFSGIPQQHPPINCFLGWQSTEDKFKVCYFGFKNIDISSSNIVLPKSQPENFLNNIFTRNFPPTIFTGPRCLWGPVYGSRPLYLTTTPLWNFADVTMADDDTNSIQLMVPILSNSLLFVLNAIYKLH